MVFADPLQMSHACYRFEHVTKTLTFDHLWQSAESFTPAPQNDASTSKSGANMWCFDILILACASRHNGVHFFNI